MVKRSLLTLVVAAVALLSAVAATTAQDRESVELALDDCLRMALKNNLDLVSARYAPELAEQNIGFQLSSFDAAFETYVDHDEREQSAVQLSTVTGSETDTLQLGVNQNLRMGANYTVGFQTTNNLQTGPNVVAPESWFSGVFLSFNQPLRKGFGTEISTEQLVLAENDLEISRTDLEGQAETIMEIVEGAYWNVVAAREALRIAELSLARAEDLLELNRKKVEVGTLAPIEITQAEAGVASQEEGVILAETTLWDAEDELRRLLAIPESDTMWDKEILNATRPTFQEMVIDVDQAIAIGLQQRAEVKSAEQTVDNRMLSERVARRQVRHQLDFAVNYTPQGSSLDSPAIIDPSSGGLFFAEQTAEMEESISRIFNGDEYNWNVRLTYRVPIGNRAAKAEYARSRLSREQSQVDLDNQEQTVRVEVRRAARAVESGIKRVQAARKNVELQQKKLDAEQKKFDNGMSTSFEVLTFQNDLADAELSEIRARLDYIKALAGIERAKGTLLESRGLSLAP
jgi:outer membrane protein TolC